MRRPTAARLPAARVCGWVLMVVGLVEAGFGVVALLAPAVDPLGMSVGAIVVALVSAVVGPLVATGRARSEAPYGALQSGTERVGRRMMRMDEQP